MALTDFLLLDACPVLGCVLTFFLYVSPVRDMRVALHRGSLDSLNPLPFAFAVANCYGWIVYGYFQQEIFLAASTLPGFLITLYLNIGAIKLQYLARHRKRWERASKFGTVDTMSTGTYSTASFSDASASKDEGVEEEQGSDFDTFVPQEFALYKFALAWMIIGVYAGFFVSDPKTACGIIGCATNLNMLFFYGSPLQVLQKVIHKRDSSNIHRGIMVMTFFNATFWLAYGLASNDPVVYVPNGLGSLLAVVQMALCVSFPETITRVGGEADSLITASSSYTVPAEVPIIVV